jgi:pilus assembly protein Flp/PilA
MPEPIVNVPDAKPVPGYGNGVTDMTKFVQRFLREESGASAAEYALILAIVGAGIAVAAAALGGAISGAMDRATTAITGATI